ncbi:Acid-sensing ion channel 1C [Holothuria leucospilota]|uniref:Acid-sensing ion channel 1C n=1 Tax=Holothuria leucospilota TaxID=206669 RepID=A0A9Q1BJF5_HOLLE|nr:Acid-sensing ion channel 1C [Holothuria leucospilota]
MATVSKKAVRTQSNTPKETVYWLPEETEKTSFEIERNTEAYYSCGSEIEKFGSTTTLHGVRYVTSRNFFITRRILWFLLLICLSVWLAHGLVAGLNKFLNYPVSTTVTVSYVESLAFPAVTFCNYNQFKNSEIHPNPNIRSVLAALALNDNSIVDWNMYDKYYENYSWNVTERAILTGHKIDEMLLECKWNTGQTCTAKNFSTVLTDFGLCHTFNSRTNGEEGLNVNQAGASQGLRVRLFLQQDEYFWGQYTGAGFKILAHPHGELPLVKQLGFSVAPGFETSVSLRHIISKSLPSPYRSNCSNKELKYSDNYTIALCRFECQVDFVVSVCGCRDYRFPGTAQLCTPKEIIQCVVPATESFNTNFTKCLCPVPCRQEVYDPKTSIASWPSEFVIKQFAKNRNTTAEFIRNNYLEVRIYFDELSSEEIAQVPSYDGLDLQSDIGAYMGLICGASVVTIVELIDCIIVYTCKRVT